jgi:hypothetical protein
LGVLDFLIKVYWAGAHPLYPEGGKMTQHLAGMKVRCGWLHFRQTSPGQGGTLCSLKFGKIKVQHDVALCRNQGVLVDIEQGGGSETD